MLVLVLVLVLVFVLVLLLLILSLLTIRSITNVAVIPLQTSSVLYMGFSVTSGRITSS